MPSSAIPACLAVTSWHTVIIGDSLPILIICPFCPTLISSKLSAYYGPHLLWRWCHFCMSSHRTVPCVISCQQKKILSLCPFCPLLIRHRSTDTKCVSWNLPSSFNLHCLSVLWSPSVFFLFCPSVFLSHSRASASVPGSTLSCLYPCIASCQFIFLCCCQSVLWPSLSEVTLQPLSSLL